MNKQTFIAAIIAYLYCGCITLYWVYSDLSTSEKERKWNKKKLPVLVVLFWPWVAFLLAAYFIPIIMFAPYKLAWEIYSEVSERELHNKKIY